VPSNLEKQKVWDAAGKGNPIRVPLGWGCNSRIVVLNPELNPEGFTFDQMLNDPTVPPIVQSRFDEYRLTTLAQTCDTVAELPEHWDFSVEYHNTYDGGYFGGEVTCTPAQVPAVAPFLSEGDVDSFMARDYSRPLDNPYLRERMSFLERLTQAAADFRYLGRSGIVLPFGPNFDGPLTVATIIFGSDIFALMAADPPKARELLLFITRAAIIRNRAVLKLNGQPERSLGGGGLADDSIQLISTDMYIDLVLPAHELWFREMSDTTVSSHNRGIHLCGDATRHFPTLVDKLGISVFDTGFPVDHGALRRKLGPTVHISGGPRVDLLRNGSPEACFEETRRILQSGVMAGGKFSLREGNNMPPCVPLENLRAVYAACLEYGWYEKPMTG